MPHFFMHLQLGSTLIEDQEGQTFRDLDAARADAILGARQIMSERVAKGQDPDGGLIRITNEAGHTLMLVPFRDAIG